MKRYGVYLLVGLCVLFWSGNFVLGRFIKDDLQPVELAFFRWAFVCIMLLPALLMLRVRRLLALIRAHFIITSLLALLGVTLFNTILYTALQTTTATNALLINSSIPIMILLFSALILKQTISTRQTAGIVLSTLGVLFLILKGDVRSAATLALNTGDVWIVLSSTVWALYSVLFKLKPAPFQSTEFFIATAYLGFLYLLPLYLVQGYPLQTVMKHLQNSWAYILYVSLFASILAFLFWNKSIDHLGAAKTGQFVHLMPLFGAILAYLFLGETLQHYHVIGALLIGAGIYTSLFLPQRGV